MVGIVRLNCFCPRVICCAVSHHLELGSTAQAPLGRNEKSALCDYGHDDNVVLHAGMSLTRAAWTDFWHSPYMANL